MLERLLIRIDRAIRMTEKEQSFIDEANFGPEDRA
jgi:hypothetical protein